MSIRSCANLSVKAELSASRGAGQPATLDGSPRIPGVRLGEPTGLPLREGLFRLMRPVSVEERTVGENRLFAFEGGVRSARVRG